MVVSEKPSQSFNLRPSGRYMWRMSMERSERELIEQALATNFELRKLYDQHVKFERRLDKLGKQVYLTPAEEVEQKRLKQLKLAGVEKMIRITAEDEPAVAA
jgi:formyltetrahydrofolate synthetase